jgi:hypothetical protein
MILLVVGYFVGTIIYSRIYISLFRNGNTTFTRANGKEVTMQRFGTSVVGDVMGIPHAVAQFFIDFGKPFLLF